MPVPYPAGGAVHRRDRIRAVDEECCEVVVTAADADWLAGFTRTLVEERLAACGHVHRGRSGRSTAGRGAVHDEPEARVGLHTRRSLVPAIVARTRELHPYANPV